MLNFRSMYIMADLGEESGPASSDEKVGEAAGARGRACRERRCH
jgi:hypothetical protein